MKFSVKLTFIFILIGSIPLFLGGVFLLSFFNDYLERVTRDNLALTAEVKGEEVTRFLDGKIEQAELMTQNIERHISYVKVEEEEIIEEEIFFEKEEVIEIYNYHHSFFENFFILNSDGEVVFSQIDNYAVDWGGSSWFDIIKKSKETVVSDIIFDENRKNLQLAIFTSFKNNNDYFIVSEIFTDNFFQIFNNETKDGCCVFLINSQGDIFFSNNEDVLYRRIDESYPLEENLSKLKGSTEFYFSGQKTISGFYVVEGLKWQIVLARSKEEVLSFLKLMTVNYLILIFILLLPIIIISFLISKRILKPLKNISAVSKRVAMGDLDVRAKAESKDEFGELAENFNKMTQEVRRVRKTIEEEKEALEAKIDERTKELKMLNDNLENEVHKRTKDMEKKIVELEKMSKLMVGRETKMIEMKKKMKEMEEYIEKLKRNN